MTRCLMACGKLSILFSTLLVFIIHFNYNNFVNSRVVKHNYTNSANYLFLPTFYKQNVTERHKNDDEYKRDYVKQVNIYVKLLFFVCFIAY